MKNSVNPSALLAGAFLLLLPQPSGFALPITGGIQFGGQAKFNTPSLTSATEVNLWKNVSIQNDSGQFALFATAESRVQMTSPWIFSSSTPFSGLWNVGGFTFDITSWTIDSRGRHLLTLSGKGTVSGDGFDVTSGEWNLTFTKHHRKGRFFFSFEADEPGPPQPTASVPPGPQPPAASVSDSGSTGWLLLCGLGSLFCFRREQRLRRWTKSTGALE